jgi:hypothetical protein
MIPIIMSTHTVAKPRSLPRDLLFGGFIFTVLAPFWEPK